MIVRTIEQIAAMTDGVLLNITLKDVQIHGVSTDSRTIPEGSLFVPLDVGAKFDGHDYVRESLVNGAAATLWQRDRIKPDDAADWPLIEVDDTMAALQLLSKRYLEELPTKVIGITGSNGKTTTKDMVASILSTKYNVHKTAGNLNSHIGLPLTVLQIDETVEMLVLEMGMRGRGEIELLTQIARPDAAVITNIGEAHLEHLGSREEIARAKLEIIGGLKQDGLFVYSGEEPLIKRLLSETPKPDRMIVVTFGSSNEWELFSGGITREYRGTRFQLNNRAEPSFTIPVLGEHNVMNALAAIAVGRHFSIPLEKIAQGLAAFELTGMRIELIEADAGFSLLNDAWNASPASTRAAIRLMEGLEGFKRKIAVLGDMRELGEQEAAFHQEIGHELKPDYFEYVFTLGSLAKHIADTAAASFKHGAVRAYDNKEQLIAELKAVVRQGDIVLVKGSRGMRLEEVVQALQQHQLS